MIFTTILHTVRKRFGISCNDYCVVDAVYFAQNNPKSKLAGWCSLSRQELADELDFSRQTVITIIKRLKELGLVEENETFFLRTTALWFEVVLESRNTPRKETLHPVKNLDTPLSNNLTPTCKETVHPPVKNLDTPPLVKEINLNNTPTTPAHVHEGDGDGVEESNILPDWAKREREEMITDINAANKEIPPKAPPYFWDEVFPELYQQVFFERVFFQTKTRFVGKTPEYVSDFIKEQIVGFQYVFADEYPDGVESFKRAKDFFINWLSAGLRKGVFDSPNQKSNHGNSNQSSKATFEDVLRVVNENYYGKPQ